MDASEHTLLVVDDNEENRDVLSRRLQKRGFAVLTAESGQRALEIIEAQRVDLVLLDVMMPGLTGLDVLRILRESPATEDLPVIMATAKTDSEDIVEALELGANDYVTKPLDFPIVLARVQAQLRSRRQVRPAEPAASVVDALESEVKLGAVLAGRYRLDSRIGRGNFGAVYRATHLDLDRGVAVKVLQSNLGTGTEAMTRFRREGMAACRVKHPNAVSVLDFGITPGGVAYLVMELLEGWSLDEELNQEGVLDPRRCAEIMVPVCRALAEAHSVGIVHRDVKPANIFLHRTATAEVPKVVDFGIAKIVGQAAVAQKLTVEGWILGTPAYMAPERFGSHGFDAKSDVYSVGVTLYQMLAGRLPFIAEDDDPMSVVALHVRQAPVALRRLDPSLPPALDTLVQRTLKKRAVNRPTASELADELTRAASGSGTPTGEPRSPAPKISKPRRASGPRQDAAPGTLPATPGADGSDPD
jgi:CheY-like chemotaxis protein